MSPRVAGWALIVLILAAIGFSAYTFLPVLPSSVYLLAAFTAVVCVFVWASRPVRRG